MYSGAEDRRISALFSALTTTVRHGAIFPSFSPASGAVCFCTRALFICLRPRQSNGDLLIGRSDDLGVTWTVPTVIARGSSSVEEDGFHKAPVPVVSIRGRLYSAVEYGCWHKKRYANVVVSVDEDADLLRAENWTVSDPTIFDLNWEGAIKDIRPAAIEGNIVEMPDSTVVNFLRYAPEKALMLRVDTVNPDNAPSSFHL
jgi:hypothetical protein